MKWPWIVLPLLVLTGCPDAGQAPGRSDEQIRLREMNAAATPADDPTPQGDTPDNEPPIEDRAPIVVQLDVYQLTVPFGSVSRNDEFWKRVDENRLDLATSDLLQKNGMRVGIGANDDWPYFKALINRHHAAAQQGTATPAEVGTIELPLRKGIEYEDVFYFNDHNVLFGRTYERCDNLLNIEFAASRRHPGDANIKVCPVIRGLRKRLEFSVLNEEREIALVNPERLFDLRLEAEVRANHFLIIAPSRISQWPDDLGSTFLIKSGHAEPLETVLLLVPRAFHMTLRMLPPPPVRH